MSRENSICPRISECYIAVQSQKAVSAYFTSEQILPFGFAEQSRPTGVHKVSIRVVILGLSVGGSGVPDYRGTRDQRGPVAPRGSPVWTSYPVCQVWRETCDLCIFLGLTKRTPLTSHQPRDVEPMLF